MKSLLLLQSFNLSSCMGRLMNHGLLYKPQSLHACSSQLLFTVHIINIDRIIIIILFTLQNLRYKRVVLMITGKLYMKDNIKV